MSLETPTLVKQERLVSLDALRGFDMFWIIGGEKLVKILDEEYHWGIMKILHQELHHPEWNGFTFYDLIFPLFMFLAGVSFSFSLAKRKQQNVSLNTIRWQVIKRGLLLVLMGLIYNKLLTFNFEDQRYPSVLSRIGLGYMCGALIALNTNLRGRLIWAAALLVGYWIMMKFIPVPGVGAGILERGKTWSGYIDVRVLPGKLYKGVQDPEGLFSTLPAIVNVLAGIVTGDWLRRTDKSGYQKAGGMFLAGILIWGAGKLWDFHFPINKNLWTSSFVCVTVGWSLMFLALFYLIIDVWKFQKWSFFFVVIGANPLFIYFFGRFIAFEEIALFILGSGTARLHPFLVDLSEMALIWTTLYFMYKRNIFIRV